MAVAGNEAMRICDACNKPRPVSQLRVTKGVTCAFLYAQYFNASSTESTCIHCLHRFNTWLTNVYEEFVKIKAAVTTIATPYLAADDGPSDLKCARCDIRLPRRKVKKRVNYTSNSHTHLERFSLKSLRLTDPRLYAKGNFVCSNCRNIFLRKPPVPKTYLMYKPIISAPKTLHV